MFSSKLPSSNNRFYDPSKSTTSVPAGSKWQACYDGGRCCIGDLYTDTVSVGGVSIDKQAVGAATTVNNAAFLNEGFDGVLGLSFHGKSFGENPVFIFYFICPSLPPRDPTIYLTQRNTRSGLTFFKVSFQTPRFWTTSRRSCLLRSSPST